MSKLRVISFDLTGTLISLSPSLGDICADAMRELGLQKIPPAKNFNLRKKYAQRAARANGFSPTSEKRSREYWRALLWEIFSGTVPTTLFPKVQEIIYARIADGRSWKAYSGVREILEAAHFLGLRCVALSNGDSRWRNALKTLGLHDYFDDIFLSAETGFAKPDPQAFEHLCLSLKIQRGELIHVGDSLSYDIEPAHAIGAEAIWLMHSAEGAPPPERVSIVESLAELPTMLRERLCADISCKHFPRATRNLLALLRGVPEEQIPDPKTIVVKKRGSESIAKKRRRVEEADYSTVREFVTPENSLDEILRSHGIFAGSVQSVIRENWDKIVPESLRNRCTPTDFSDGWTTLVVSCESAIVRQQIEFRKRDMLKKIRKISGCENIKKLVFTNEFSA